MTPDARAVAVRMGWDPDTLRHDWSFDDLAQLRHLTEWYGAAVVAPAPDSPVVPCKIVDGDGSVCAGRRVREGARR